MKNKKFFSLLALMLAVMMLAAGCAGGASSDSQVSESSQESLSSEETPAGSFTMNIGFLKGPTGMGAASLMEQDSVGETAVDYTFTVAGAPDVLVSQLISGELDAAALPSNSVAAVYQKTNQGVQVVAVNTLGVLYVMEKGDSIQSVADLRGKSPLERAHAIIENCAHPDYRPLLRQYLSIATGGHTHHNLPAAFARHNSRIRLQLYSGPERPGPRNRPDRRICL